MAKKVKAIVKLNLVAGQATAAPPAGPALGQHGVPIMEFVNQYNAKTADKRGQVIPAVITIYEDRTFTFVTKLPPVSELIKKKLKIKSGSGTPNKDKVGKLSAADLEAIATEKMDDLNALDIAAAKKVVAGTARSMGVDTEV